MCAYVALIVCLLVSVLHQCKSAKYVDLSYDIAEDTAHWPSSVPYTKTNLGYGYQEGGFWYEGNSFCMAEHAGTHIDSPSHFVQGKWSTDRVPLENLFGEGVVIDMRQKVMKDSIAELSTDDVRAWLDKHGSFPDKAIVFVRTGWAASRYGNKLRYFGTDGNDTSNLIFPGISNEVAQLLVKYDATSGSRILGVGIDTPSLDHGPSKTFETHQTLFASNIYGLENVANLDKLPVKGFQVTVMPIKLRSGSGGPARIFATIPDSSDAASVTISNVLLMSILTFFCIWQSI